MCVPAFFLCLSVNVHRHLTDRGMSHGYGWGNGNYKTCIHEKVKSNVKIWHSTWSIFIMQDIIERKASNIIRNYFD